MIFRASKQERFKMEGDTRLLRVDAVLENREGFILLRLVDICLSLKDSYFNILIF